MYTSTIKLRHHKFFDEGVNHAADMISGRKVVQCHRKQLSLISSQSLDMAHNKKSPAS
jgi:hypothetical protein